MKLKFLIAIVCLGLFLGINNYAKAVGEGAACGTSANGATCDSPYVCTDSGGKINATDSSDYFYCGAASSTSTAAATGATSTTTFANPITATTAQGLLTNLLTALQGVVAIIAIIMIIVGGLMYMFAGVNEKMVENAKATIGGAIIGLAIVFAGPAFLKEILTIVGGTDNSGLLNTAPTLQTIAKNILNLLLSIVGIIAIISLIVGGGFYLTAYGDEDRIKKGKDIITASLTGIIIAAAALVIVQQIATLIGS